MFYIYIFWHSWPNFELKLNWKVFSGHVHYENLGLPPYDGFHHQIKQFILTSINYQEWITFARAFRVMNIELSTRSWILKWSVIQTIWYSEESGKTWGPSIPSYYEIHVLDDEIQSVTPMRIQNIWLWLFSINITLLTFESSHLFQTAWYSLAIFSCTSEWLLWSYLSMRALSSVFWSMIIDYNSEYKARISYHI